LELIDFIVTSDGSKYQNPKHLNKRDWSGYRRMWNWGFSDILLHNVNREQQAFIETFGEKVLPALAQD
jgi:hypothetical protein